MPNFKGKSGGGPSAMKKYGMGNSPIQFQGYSGGHGMDSDTRPRKGVDPETGQMGSAAEKRSPVKRGQDWTKQLKHPMSLARTSRGGGGGATRRQRRRR